MRPPRAAALTATALFCLALTACGGEAGGTDAASTPADGSDAFPVELETEFGTTEVTEEPERVVVLGLIDADPVLALGVTPVAVQQWLPQFDEYGVGPWAEDLIADAVESGETEVLPNTGIVEYDLEQIAALDPDLVVAISANIDQAMFDQLSQLAPVVARPPGSVNFGVSLEDSTLMIGQALGRADRAAELVAETEELYAEAAAGHPEFTGRSAALTRPLDNGWAAWQAADVRVQIMDSLGFVQPEPLAAIDDGAFSTTLSRERLDLLDADVLVVIVPEGFEDAVASDDVLQALDVVQRGDLVELDAADVGGAMAYNSVLSARTVVDEIVPRLAEVVAD